MEDLQFTTELGRFNLEIINLDPLSFTGDYLSQQNWTYL